MKKSRLLSVLLCLALLSGLLATFASAADSGSAILDEMDVNAKAAVLVDPDTGEILYEKNAHAHNYPASITKVMTCLLTLEAVDRGELSLEQTVTASSALHTGIGEGASTADIKEGEQIRIIDLLYAALIPSANEACNVMAEAVSGDVASFVELMNTRAAELGMEDTHFSNTHGYHDDDHYTSAYDIYLMCREAMKHETFRTIVGSKNYTMPATNLHPEPRIIRSTNALISNFRVAGYIYEYATGIKTGSTPEAGYCLAASATRENRNLISAVMGCEREPGTSGSEGYIYFDETIRLFKWGFANFSTQTILDNTKRDIPEVEVTLGKDAASVTLMPDGKLTALLPNDVSAENFTYDYTLETRSVEAPVEGECLAGADLSGLEFRRVRLHRCRFQNCDFSGAVFDRVEWSGCDFSNCRFGGTVWTDTVVRDCKGDGGRFTASRWRGCTLGESAFRCANFTQSRWKKCRMENCQLRRAVLAEADVAGLSPHRTGFQEVDFFRTPLKGVDFSDCALEGITVSESLGELRGMKINPAQAVDLIPLLGIQLL